MEVLQNNFSFANPVNTSALQPQEAGLDEHFSFLLNITVQNGTTLFFAVRTKDKQALTSEVSNIDRVTKFVPSPKVISKAQVISVNYPINPLNIFISVCLEKEKNKAGGE